MMEWTMTGFGRFAALGPDECRDLLRTHSVARLGWQSVDGPLILPITYRIDGDDVVFRTKPGTALSGFSNSPVALQLDSLDDETRTGWSVLARGTASASTDADALAAWASDGPQPWVSDGRTLVVRVRVAEVTGRIVSAD